MPEMIETLARACGKKKSYAWLEAISSCVDDTSLFERT